MFFDYIKYKCTCIYVLHTVYVQCIQVQKNLNTRTAYRFFVHQFFTRSNCIISFYFTQYAEERFCLLPKKQRSLHAQDERHRRYRHLSPGWDSHLRPACFLMRTRLMLFARLLPSFLTVARFQPLRTSAHAVAAMPKVIFTDAQVTIYDLTLFSNVDVFSCFLSSPGKFPRKILDNWIMTF